VYQDKNGRYAGKRIIGIAGDEVNQYGQYVNLYTSRSDLGIVKSRKENDDGVEGRVSDGKGPRDAESKIIVPPNHVWLEGDFPLFSLDSRQKGPIPVDWIRGRILFRVWPFRAPQITRKRPEPLALAESLSGEYNLHPHPLLSLRSKEEQ